MTNSQPNPTPDGILLVDKPAGMTSHDVVFRVRRIFGTKKVGHTGTLDPMATGVLVVLLGRAAKAAEYVSHDEKVYEATLRLGLTTDTEDTTGTVLTTSDEMPTPNAVLAALPAFRGRILQIPPMYSALKVNGQKLCNLARAGVTVEREARPVTIFELTATPTDTPTDYHLRVRASGGTYIRTLCADIGAALGCGGAMAGLRRVEAGGFPIGACTTLDALEGMSPEEKQARLLPTEALFSNLPSVTLPAFYHTLCRNGCEIYLAKLGVHHPVGTRVKLFAPDDTFFALGEVRAYESGAAVKAIKLFQI